MKNSQAVKQCLLPILSISRGVFIWLLSGSLFFFCNESNAQDISLLSLGNQFQQTYINPAATLKNTWNISLGNTQMEILTDGPTYNQLTDVNKAGKRYIHPDNWQSDVNYENLIQANLAIHTLDVGIVRNSWTFSGGHAFRTFGSLAYTEDLLKLVANGNGPYINQSLEIGPALDYLVFNELYLGVQKKFNRFTVGVKAKALFGVSGLRTESSSVAYKTKEDFYQWEFLVDYNIRSSSSLTLRDVTDFEFNASGFTFDHLFYNNPGLAFDIGVNMQLSKNLSIFWSALDLGFIKWDFLPRNYKSQGKFTFEGIDPITYINDTTGLQFVDSIVQFFPFTTVNESFTTSLNNRFYLGGSYQWKDTWSFQGLVRFHRSFVKSNAQLSVSAMRHWKWIQAGASLTVTNGNFFNLGAILQVKLQPVSVFVATDNILGAFALFDQKLANLRGGAQIAF